MKTRQDLRTSVVVNPPGKAAVFLTLTLLFFASGFSGLVYQVVWTRMLVLVFGATTFATATVLAIFMGGLALGSLAAGRCSDRLQKPLVCYGILEAIIGVWALVTPALFAAATPVYKYIWLHTHASALPFSLLRFVCTAAILIVPTTCMGATLPVLSRCVADKLESVGSRIGSLYCANTFGAVLGAVLSGFCLLPGLGIQATILVSAVINLALFAATLALNRLPRFRFQSPDWHKDGGVVPVPSGTAADRDLLASTISTPGAADLGARGSERTVMLAFACSGAMAMVYEVCWTRTLLMVIGSSTYAFTVMLGAFLIGIFGGGLLCSRFVDRLKNPIFCFAVLQVGIGLLTLLGMQQFNYLPFLNLYLNANLHLDAAAAMFLRFILAGSILIPTTFCLGATFPLVVKGCVRNLPSLGRSVGALYCSNTVGAIAGAFLSGFLCVPFLGVERTLLCAGLVNVLLGLALLWAAKNVRRSVLVAATTCSVPLICIFLQFPLIWDRNILLSVQSQRRIIARHGFPYANFEQWRKSIADDSVLKFWSDGPCSNVGVKYLKKNKITCLVTNGNIDASDDADMPVQALLSGFPLLVHRQARDVAVIGWGSGQTLGTATLFPLRSLVAVELEPAVIAASKYFHHCNHTPERDPRVSIELNDGRNYLLATDSKFDVIVSEPSNPWQSGVCNLFTREYFAICRERLKPGGMLSAWLQTAEVPPRDLCAVLAALRSTFKYTLTLQPRPANLIILASDSPLVIDMPQVAELLTHPDLQREFNLVGVNSAESLAAHIVVGLNGLDSLTDSRINSDDRNYLEFDVGQSYEDKLFVSKNAKTLAAMCGEPWRQLSWGVLEPRQKAASLARIAQESMQYGGNNLALGWAQQSLAVAGNLEAMRLSGRILAAGKDYAQAKVLFDRALALRPNDAELLMLRGSVNVALHDRLAGRRDLEQAVLLDPASKVNKYLLAGSFRPELMGGAPATRAEQARRVLRLLGDLPADAEFVGRWPKTCLIAGEACFALDDYELAKRYLAAYLRLEPQDLAARSLFNIINRH